MSTSVPTPVAAALGIVPTVFGRVRQLPSTVVQLPIFALSSALTSIETARREYAELAERGERLIARLRGTSFDEFEDKVEDALQGTPLARPYDAAEDALEDAAEAVTALVRKAPGAVRSAPQSARKAPAAARKAAGTTARTVGAGLDKAADTAEDLSQAAAGAADQAEGAVEAAADKVEEVIEQVADTVAQGAEAVADKAEDLAEEAEDLAGKAEGAADLAKGAVDEAAGAEPAAMDDAQAPKGEATPKATQPDDTRIGTAAPEDVVRTVEQVSATVGGPVVAHSELPLPDYDHMTLGSLRGRMRSLDVPQLVQIRDYEKAHADRLPIVTMLDNRIAKLASDPTAPLSGSAPAAASPAR